MNKGFIVILVLTVILIGIFVSIYFYYELPKKNDSLNVNYVNVSIKTLYNNKNVEVPVQVNINDYFYSNITTLKYDYVLLSIPANYNISVFNIIDGQYYKTEKSFYSSNDTNIRIDLVLIKPADVNITSVLNKEKRMIDLKINVDGEFKNSILCFKWGLHIINLNLNFTQTELSSYDKCYTLGNLVDENVNMQLSYIDWGTISSDDYIDVYLIDDINTTIVHQVKY